jgi:hypothetical protein
MCDEISSDAEVMSGRLIEAMRHAALWRKRGKAHCPAWRPLADRLIATVAASASAFGSAATGRGSAGAVGIARFWRPASQRVPSLACRFRTFQARPKDLPILIWQVEHAGDPASKREGHAMDERTIDQTQSWISDTQAMGLYSTLLFVVIALWVYVPA